jgi:hypothetical protein
VETSPGNKLRICKAGVEGSIPFVSTGSGTWVGTRLALTGPISEDDAGYRIAVRLVT